MTLDPEVAHLNLLISEVLESSQVIRPVSLKCRQVGIEGACGWPDPEGQVCSCWEGKWLLSKPDIGGCGLGPTLPHGLKHLLRKSLGVGVSVD